MKRITVVYGNGNNSVFECTSASWGDQSRNLIMRNVTRNPITDQKPVVPKPVVPFVVLPLAGIHFFMEEEI